MLPCLRFRLSLNFTKTIVSSARLSTRCISTKAPEWPYLYSSKRIMAPQLDPYFKQVDSLSDHFIDRLRKAVAIPSVSADDERRPDVVKVRCPCLKQASVITN
jgi:hypothetical protein